MNERALEAARGVQDDRLRRLEARVEALGPSVTAFSGGVDSTLVAVVSHRCFGDQALAVTGVSASLAAAEREQAVRLAVSLGLRHRLVETQEISKAGYRANAGDRCYHCKSELFGRLTALAAREGLAGVLSGDNLDDQGDHRPGLLAGAERGVHSPLVDVGLRKADIRELAAQLGLANHDKPAAPCLASRIPHGVTVDASVLARVERAEARIHALGFTVFRVRHHGELARLEVPVDDLARALECRMQLIAALKGAGYLWASLDLSGFRSGSLNIALQGDDHG